MFVSSVYFIVTALAALSAAILNLLDLPASSDALLIRVFVTRSTNHKILKSGKEKRPWLESDSSASLLLFRLLRWICNNNATARI